MTTQTNEITLCIDRDLPPSLLSNIELGFRTAFENAERWRVKALAIHVTSLGQTADIKEARTIRIELKNIRVAAEKTRVNLKADALRFGKAIDGVNNLLLAAIVPLETHLEEQEKFGERLAALEQQRLHRERSELLAPYLSPGQIIPALETMTMAQWDNYLSDATFLHNAKVAANQRVEADRIAREQAEAVERERVRLENVKLRAEALAREQAIAHERAAVAQAQRVADALAATARNVAADKARREQRRLEAIAEASRAEAQAVRNELAKAEAMVVAAKATADAEAKALADDEARAASAPDREKIIAFSQLVRALPVPVSTTEKGRLVMQSVSSQVERFAVWIEGRAAEL